MLIKKGATSHITTLRMKDGPDRRADDAKPAELDQKLLKSQQ